MHDPAGSSQVLFQPLYPREGLQAMDALRHTVYGVAHIL